MIKTVTLNPALDKTVEIRDFKLGAVNRISSLRIDAGGKGINVAKVIKALNGKSQALGVLAGRSGNYIRNYLEENGIEQDFLFIQGETRTNLKVVDPVRQIYTDINEPGVEILSEDLQKLEERVFAGMDQDSILVLSGSVPSNISNSLYGVWIKRAKEFGAKTILDADGELLYEGIQAAPYLVKPNIHELERLIGQTLGNVQEVLGAAKSVLEQGVEVVAVSLGAEGAVFARKGQFIYAEGLPVEVKSTVGAGDAMVAALSIALEQRYSWEKTVKLSVATSAAQVTSPGTQPPILETVNQYLEQVQYRYL